MVKTIGHIWLDLNQRPEAWHLASESSRQTMDGHHSDAGLVLVQLLLAWIRRGTSGGRVTALNQVRQLESTIRTIIIVVGNPPSMSSMCALWKSLHQAMHFQVDDPIPTNPTQLQPATVTSFASIEWRPLCELLFSDYGAQLAQVMPPALLTLQHIQTYYLSGMASEPVSGSEWAENVLNDCQLVLATAEFPFRMMSSSASLELAPLALPSTAGP